MFHVDVGHNSSRSGQNVSSHPERTTLTMLKVCCGVMIDIGAAEIEEETERLNRVSLSIDFTRLCAIEAMMGLCWYRQDCPTVELI